jgi:hypothetical protein
MMKLFISIILLLFTSHYSYAQAVSYHDFKKLIPFLQDESFSEAYEKSSEILSSSINDSSDLRGMLTYINIFSAAGMVTRQQMTYDAFEQNAKRYIGSYIVMPAHPCIDSSLHGFNSLKFLSNDSGGYKGMVIAANNDKTSILFFEYFYYTGLLNPSQLIGKTIRSGGILQRVETNPNKSTIWVARLHVGNAFTREMEPR